MSFGKGSREGRGPGRMSLVKVTLPRTGLLGVSDGLQKDQSSDTRELISAQGAQTSDLMYVM